MLTMLRLLLLEKLGWLSERPDEERRFDRQDADAQDFMRRRVVKKS